MKRLLAEFATEAKTLPWANTKRLGLSDYDVVVAASIIEREAFVANDRPKIAAVIYNRLAAGMTLGMDSTIAYIDPDPSNGLTVSDFKIQSPYNTRLHTGLPPTPIASPGLASLRAALAPANVPYLYFVTCGSAGHQRFSTTYAQFLQDRPPALDDAKAGSQVGGATRTVGIIGWPVAHSLSPAIHNAAFRALGLDWIYVPLPVRPEHVFAALTGPGGLGFSGVNVTMPHKTVAAETIDDLSDEARALGAVNTIVVHDRIMRGENTDARFERFLRDDAGFDPAGRAALVYGSGGAARACALALARGGLKSLAVAVRDPARARALLRVIEPFSDRGQGGAAR